MGINITPVESSIKPKYLDLVEISTEAIIPEVIDIDIEQVFAKFLELEVGDGAASIDTVKSYLCQSRQYFEWCRNNLVPPLEADLDDIKLDRQYLINQDYFETTLGSCTILVNREKGDR
ncbi:hypothetical protein [Pleurocapsa sp. FMAR1]|uniref:hypothetical protein n=1 Tax=Pleurocapsa sp. FMAR1 TaxID=3040204 RepID=UPI0029C79E76|nr:hypothetical protein [Pleurocapsa sp. FMAR1]